MLGPGDIMPGHFQSQTVRLEGSGLSIAQLVAIARDGVRVELSPAARGRVALAREIVERATGGAPVYGLNTGLGAKVGERFAPDQSGEFQRAAIRARAVCVGPPLAREVVRAMIAARAAGMSVGGSGVSPHVLAALLDLLNAGVHPIVPAIGSIGAADLGPLAHMALPLIGEGEAEYRGELLAGKAALERAGLTPVALGPKDAIALLNANSLSVGRGALVAADARAALQACVIAAALSFEGFRANLGPLDPRLQAARPAAGQSEAAASLLRLFAASALALPSAARRVQDPLSFRCYAPVQGAALEALATAARAVEVELNAAGDNPLVLPETGEIQSTGNFHIPWLALSFETLGQALVHVAALAAERVIKLVAPKYSDLPLQLVPEGALTSGYATIQKTLTALLADLRHLANPVSLDFLPVSDGVEDHAVNAPRVVEKTGMIVERLRYVAAIELLVAAQAIDLRGPLALGSGVRAAHRQVRAIAPFLSSDRPAGPEIERLTALIAAGRLQAEVEDALQAGSG
jgi:histidine ammonia-lyase